MFSCLRWISLFWLVAIGISYAQITTVMLSQGGEPVELSCEGQADSGFTYQWYRKSSYSTNTMLPIAGADSSHYVTDSFPDREVRHYYCVVSSPDGESAVSNAVVAAYTGLPVVNINTVEGEEPSAEYVYAPDGLNGRGITNASKVPASMEIVDGNGNLLYESGEYVQKESGLTVKIRGNTSVDLAGKSSYKLKLQKKADLLASLISRSDDSYRNKDWILLKTTRTLDTFIGFTVCDILGTPWTPKYAFVELVVNNDYRGLYLLMESVSRDESRVDVSKSGYIIENDAYWWNEEVYFSTSKYKQKYTFKYPDDEDISEDRISYIKDFMDSLEEHLRDGSYNEYIDVESFARWLLVHDILGSFDAAGSNIFMSKYDATSETKLSMVTNWDFDSNFRQEGNWSKQHDAEVAYAPFLFRSDDPKFAETYLALFDSLAPIFGTLSNRR